MINKNSNMIAAGELRVGPDYAEAKGLFVEKSLVQKRLREIDKRLRELRLDAAYATHLARIDLDLEAQLPLFSAQEKYPSLHK